MPLNPQLLSLALQIGQQRQQQAIREQERAEKRKDDLFDQLLSLRTKGVPLKSVEPFAVSQGIGSDRLELLRGLDKTLRQTEKSQEAGKSATGLAEKAGSLAAGTAGVGGIQRAPTAGAERVSGEAFRDALIANSQTTNPLANLPGVEQAFLLSRAEETLAQQQSAAKTSRSLAESDINRTRDEAKTRRLRDATLITLGNRDTGDIKSVPASNPGKIARLVEQGYIAISAPQITGTTEQVLSKKSQEKVDERLFQATEGLARLAQIRSGFKPEFQQFDTRLEMAFLRQKDKTVGLNPREKQALNDFFDFKRTAINNLNLYIKEITGAQLSQAEAERLTRGLPNPGTGIFDGDSPTEFQSKLNSVARELELSIARMVYAQKNGIVDLATKNAARSLSQRIPLGSMEQIIAGRTREMMRELMLENPTMTEDQALKRAAPAVRREFGLR